MVGWFASWLVGWLFGWLVGWLVSTYVPRCSQSPIPRTDISGTYERDPTPLLLHATFCAARSGKQKVAQQKEKEISLEAGTEGIDVFCDYSHLYNNPTFPASSGQYIRRSFLSHQL